MIPTDHLTVVSTGIKMIVEAIYALDGSEVGAYLKSRDLFCAKYSLAEVAESINKFIEANHDNA